MRRRPRPARRAPRRGPAHAPPALPVEPRMWFSAYKLSPQHATDDACRLVSPSIRLRQGFGVGLDYLGLGPGYVPMS